MCIRDSSIRALKASVVSFISTLFPFTEGSVVSALQQNPRPRMSNPRLSVMVADTFTLVAVRSLSVILPMLKRGVFSVMLNDIISPRFTLYPLEA